MRLRTQLTLTVTALVALVVAIAGLVIVVRIDHRDRADLDTLLTTRAEQVRAAATKNGSLPTDGSFAIRLIQGGEMLKQVGSSAGFPLPAKDGYSTVSSGDDEWRSLAETLPTGAQMQILVSLDDLKEQHTDNVLIVDLLVLLAAVLSAAGVWFATGLVLRPFQRLLSAARDLDPADPDQSLPEVKSPREVAELTATLNDLLARARASSGSTSGPDRAPIGAHAASPGAQAASLGAVGSSAGAGASAGAVTASEAPETVGAREAGATQAEAAQADDRQAEATQAGPAAVAEPTVEMRAVGRKRSPESTPAPNPEAAPGSSSGRASDADADSAPAPPAPAPVPVSIPAEPTPVAPAPVAAPSLAVAELRPSMADLGYQLDQLLDNPEMPATQRHLILAVMADEHRRMTALIDGDA